MNSLLKILSVSAIVAESFILSMPIHAQSAEDASAACTEASRLIAEEDYVGALDEAEWCVEGLRQLKQARTLLVFPDEVINFEGGEIDSQSALGITFIERSYTLDDQSVNVSLTGGVAGGSLSALAQFATAFGVTGSKKMRIQKRTVVDMTSTSGQSEYIVELKSGGMLTISSSDIDSKALLEFVRAFPIAKIDESVNP